MYGVLIEDSSSGLDRYMTAPIAGAPCAVRSLVNSLALLTLYPAEERVHGHWVCLFVLPTQS